MSSFMNGSGSGTSSNINDQSGLTGALAGGSGSALTVGNGTPDSPRFTLPPDIANVVAGGTGTLPTAGLTGTQSGMTMPNFAAAMGGDGNYSFNMPGNSGTNWGGLGAAASKIGSAMQDNQKLQGGTGRVSTQAKNFNAPVIALPMASGSTAGNSLLQMMQRYQPGAQVGYTGSNTGYGMR